MAERVKILLLGPQQGGKTAVSSFLSGLREQPAAEYRPTVGCRIVEFDREGLSIGGRKAAGSGRVAVEMWDVSGDRRYESCWPAIAKDCAGAVILYNPDEKTADKDLEFWFKTFQGPARLKETNCIVFAHRKLQQAGGKMSKTKLPKALGKVVAVDTSLDVNPENMKNDFDRYLEVLIQNRREEDERSVLQ